VIDYKLLNGHHLLIAWRPSNLAADWQVPALLRSWAYPQRVLQNPKSGQETQGQNWTNNDEEWQAFP
jgi:hypothetical protein